MLRLLAVMILLAGQAGAGAWPRDKGATFLSFSTDFRTDGSDDLFTALYLEYGLGHNITVGLDLGTDFDGFSKALSFARLPLIDPAKDNKLAFELGLGMIDDSAVLRPGLMIGRGVRLGKRWGWVSLEAYGTTDISDGDIDLSADFTLGLNLTAAMKAVVQLRARESMTDPEDMRLAPSLVIERAPGRHLELGVSAGLENGADMGLKLGIWHQY